MLGRAVGDEALSAHGHRILNHGQERMSMSTSSSVISPAITRAETRRGRSSLVTCADRFVEIADAVDHHAERGEVVHRHTPSGVHGEVGAILLDGNFTQHQIGHELMRDEFAAVGTRRDVDQTVVGFLSGDARMSINPKPPMKSL